MFPTLYDFGTITIFGRTTPPIGIHSYGVMMALAFLSVLFGLQRELPRKNINVQLAHSIIVHAVLGGIIGAKIYYAIEFRDLSALFSPSGLVWYGGLIAGSVAVLYTIHRSGSPILPTIDAIGPLLLLGHGFGRIGCLLAGDGCYGRRCTLPWPWGMEFPVGIKPTIDRISGEVFSVYPTPLYDFLLMVLGFSLFWRFRKKLERVPGVIFGLVLVYLGVERLIIEFWRRNEKYVYWQDGQVFFNKLEFSDQLSMPFGFTGSQLISILLLIPIGFFLVYWSRKRPIVIVDEPLSEPQLLDNPVKKIAKKRKKKRRT
ncbi:hypothetical protein CMK22_16895 [Candidatus Poribacteria bacterium]|nr:hypothetical protein [Candidatus Poribacteria bacterium]